jgi:hypothetical protein
LSPPPSFLLLLSFNSATRGERERERCQWSQLVYTVLQLWELVESSRPEAKIDALLESRMTSEIVKPVADRFRWVY